MIYRFDEYSIDAERRELRRGSATSEVQPKVLDLIIYLIRKRERAVPREELFECLWGDVVVSEGVLSTAIHAARAALGDSAARQWAIKTVARHGYRFVAPVDEEENRVDSQPAARAGDPWTADAFVGREGYLARLDSALAAAVGGRGRVVVVTGESGIGKTRLMDELVSRARLWEGRILAAWCYEGEGSPPYWPWAQLLRAALEGGRPEDTLRDMGAGAADLVGLVPALLELRSDLPSAPRLQSGPARFRLFESVATFIGNAAKRKPILILMDDLHLADHASLRLLSFFARTVRSARVLAVVAVRVGEEVDPVLEETLAELAHHFPGERMHLDGLTMSETGHLIESLTGRAPSQALLQTIAERSEGNPFFVKELVNLLQTQGRLDQEPELGAWMSSVPPGVRDVILRRLHRRSKACQRVLALAAVLGPEFRRDLLERLVELGSEELTAALDEASAAGFLRLHPSLEGTYRFSHGLMQETLYADWGAGERAFWHRRAGEALEALAASSPDIPSAELAYHFLQAAADDDLGKAVDYAVRAANQAAAIYAYDEAAKQYGRALAMLERFPAPDEVRRCELLVALGTAQLDAERSNPRGRDSLLRAAHLARDLGRPELLARAAVRLASVAQFWGPGDSTVIELLEDALAGLGKGDEALRARVMADLAMLRISADTLDQGASLSEEAVELARKAADSAALGEALTNQCLILSGPDHIHERMRQAEALLDLAGENRDAELALFGHSWRLTSVLELGEIEAADRELEALERTADEARDWRIRWYALTVRGMRAFLEGHLGQTEQFVLEAFTQGHHDPTPFTVYVFGTQLLWLRKEQARLGEIASDAGADYLDSRFPLQAAFRATTAFLDAERGSLGGARRELERFAANELADLPKDYSYLYSLAVLSELCATLGDPASAAIVYDVLLPFADRYVVFLIGSVCLGSASRYLGLLATAMRRWERAEEHFAEALERNQRIQACVWSAHTQLDWAKMLCSRGDADGLARSRGLLRRCLATAGERGLAAVEKEAAAVAERVRG